MTEFENMEAVELSMEEMDQVAGGYKRPIDKKGFIIVQIVRGDTLIKIANRYNTTVEQIMKDNPKIKDKRLIYTGDYLYIRKK